MNGNKIKQGIVNGFSALLHGELMHRLNIDKYFIHIVFLFLLLFTLIVVEMKIETTMSLVEKNKKELNDMRIYHAQKTVTLVKFGRLGTIEQMLEDLGSDVTLADKPADRIEK